MSDIAFFPVEDVFPPKRRNPAPRKLDAGILDLRNTSLAKIGDSATQGLRRIIPHKEDERVPVAAFNACI
jgi:hypothetical protein